MANNVLNISDMNKVCAIRENTPSISLFEITILSSNEIREIFCEGLKWICKLFEINVQWDF